MEDPKNNINVLGARVHNLKNITVSIPRNSLSVITGLSGSGKSSLAFDTIYAEGQRRYIETFSAYARQFLGNLERPDVDEISGLSPVISIEQKTTNKNPRSTVGTITEIYDFLRLFYARAGIAYSYHTGEKMVKYSEKKILELIVEKYKDKNIMLLAPIVESRKGHYRELFIQIAKKGYLNVSINGKIQEIQYGLKLDRYKTHNIEIVIDKLRVHKKQIKRLGNSLQLAMKEGNNKIIIKDNETNDLKYYSKNLMCPTTGISYNEPAPHSFSFNSPHGACNHCKGIGQISEIDLDKIIPDKTESIHTGGIRPLGKYKNNIIFSQIEAIAHKYKFSIKSPIKNIPQEALNIILYGSTEAIKVNSYSVGYTISFEGIIRYLDYRKNNTKSNFGIKWAEQFINYIKCPSCSGSRLKKESLFFKIANKNIAEVSNMDIKALALWIENIEDHFDNKQKIIAIEIVKEILSRTHFLLNVGLDYLSLNRPSKTLSGGESQRIRLATQIGTELVNVLYILDEPSIGLHQRDNLRLINSLKSLRDNGNSVVVVEHDKDMMLNSDYIIDMGPYAGKHGGEIMAAGTPQQILNSNTLTAQYLNEEKNIEIPKTRREGNGKTLKITGANGHNLKNVSIELPLGKFICITGVSGSGKSSLINGTLYPILNTQFYRSHKKPLPYDKIEGMQYLDKVIEVNQSPLGRTPRSNPVTYTNIFSDIRKLFEKLQESQIRGYKAGRFSFNVKGGRCETCKGAGIQTIEMNFLPNVYVECKDCNGKRYNKETLEVRYKAKSINDVLDMTINQATEFFSNIPYISQKLAVLKEVGLGYLKLGQPSTTLSGGESQRVKLAADLGKRSTGKTLYILDEPTTGLHFDDIRVLLEVLNKIVDKGNTLIVIEHNMDVIKVADHIIDMGKEGGNKGGEIIFAGTPERLLRCKNNHTAKFLKHEMK